MEETIKTLPIIKAMTLAGFAKSNSEAKRLIHQGAVNVGVDRIKITDPNCFIEILKEGTILRVGHKKIIRLLGGTDTIVEEESGLVGELADPLVSKTNAEQA